MKRFVFTVDVYKRQLLRRTEHERVENITCDLELAYNEIQVTGQMCSLKPGDRYIRTSELSTRKPKFLHRDYQAHNKKSLL